MKYMLLIHHDAAPTPNDPDAWANVPDDVKAALPAEWQALSQTPGVTPGEWMEGPETATTVRSKDGQTVTTDGPFAGMKEAIGGYLIYEADDLDAAIALAAKVPSVRFGGAVEIRPIHEGWS